MRALCWHGKEDIRCDTVPDPKILHSRDAIIKVTSCAICGSDLHLMGGFAPGMKSGDVMGHETMGEVVEVGSDNKKLKVGDRIVVPFTIGCGECRMCQSGMWSLCERSNPAGAEQAKQMGYATAGLFGFSHLYGGFPGGQAEYLRVPYADVGPIKVPEGLSDEQVLFLSDIFPTGYQAAENCNIQRGDTVAVFGCGPVGLFAIKSAFMLGAERVIAIDTVPERLALARQSGAETLDYAAGNLQQRIVEMTNGKGPDSVIEAVGMESHGEGGIMETLQTDLTSMERPYALQQAIMACRPGGTVSLPGVFVGAAVPVALGAAFGKALTFKMGQTHVQRHLEPLMKRILEGEIDPSFIITHRIGLEDGPEAYKTFRDKKDGCVKVVIHPNA
ncbi:MULTISPECIES: zinc-dependent alcohol dehydrogenase [Rhizobium]|uniref:Glutathione-dependent formaldehyde dehydrogenase n=1 Tax=Rhizobium rhododendri TaxID=2506430 RepID=A0ABY8ITV0_9HYPH|nr:MULTISPECIES: zinc-dependent alcohol dehydrogenase [Rhizobium]MBZ5759520.1 glutathione-dependent formaldehyde dehydrogenase [Rhizobium sp. VS19-DR96]MBZ5765747.1 glutathione-dependent formaldehyde dehydrogenase [Rhizobium sp. VS19-DR129.2]MBZ5773831.1 glutathione-dependent formaldehyde dehydrogenase [Rhizobium sp. VS19-DRK62.2]MBZ5784903.1 glutathione-dependent formaldehyde dehydrogenase [Rhizobium sp. VS19-DR121]MBZ5802020.1 glutathione-dependent formaldehyde dehydrogenase [Rhizobium sp. V